MIAKRTSRTVSALFFSLFIAHATAAARDRATGFDLVPLSLPGVPAAVQPADIDGDGYDDLVVVVVYNEWASVTSFEEAEFDEVEGLVEVMNVVSAVIDRRELRVYPGLADGSGFGPALPALDLDTSIHALQATASPSGASGQVLVALTDDGLAAIGLDRSLGALVLRPLAELVTRFAGNGRFYSNLEFLHDLDADGYRDALVPIESGWAIVPGTPIGFAAERATIVQAPSPPEIEEPEKDEEPKRRKKKKKRRGDSENEEVEKVPEPQHPRLPEVRDLNGDGLAELVVMEGEHDFDSAKPRTILYRNLGDLRFAKAAVLVAPVVPQPAQAVGEHGALEGSASGGELPANDAWDREHGGREEWDREEWDDEQAAREEVASGRIVYVGDLDGDGQAVAVVRRELDRWGEDPSMRQEIRSFKAPLFEYRLYALTAGLTLGPQRHTFEASGYNFGGSQSSEDDEVEFRLPGGFQDLDGDGRLDLVSITVDFSILPMLTRALVTRSVKVQMNFHTTCQAADGDFETVQGMDLSGQFKVSLRNSRVRHLSQFAGDFNGDGRADFVQLGRGRKVTIHHGQPGCKYPSEGDKTIHLERKPKHLGLLRILDLNGDAHADLYVVHPLEKPRKDRSTPVRVDIYLSRPR